MKLAILTTQTIHHTYFINELNKYSKIDLVIVEKPINVYKNNLNHPFEKIRDEFEKKHCLGDLDIKINSIANTLNVEDINENQGTPRQGITIIEDTGCSSSKSYFFGIPVLLFGCIYRRRS